MEAVWLHSKITIPKVADAIINRKRLYSFIQIDPQPRVTVIQATAGYGKTTILSQWVQQLVDPVAWLSIDVMDNDPRRFWQYVIHAIVKATDNPIDKKLEHLFDLQYMPPLELIVDSLLNELSLIESPLHIVFDDYHYVELDIIHEMMTRLINYLPEHIHLYMASRTKLPFPLALWRMESWIAEIGIEELSFTYQEVEAFYQKKHIVMDKAEFCEGILQKTAGWAAGVQLAGISEERKTGSLHRSTSFVTEYIMQEIIATLPITTQQFLLETSLLKVLDPELCNALTGREDSYEQLSELVDLGILTIRLSPQQQTFRYHQLLAEVLEQERRNKYTTEQLQVLAETSAGLLYARGDYNTAIELALEQQLYSLADQWILEQLLDIFHSGQIGLLIQWVDSFLEVAYPVNVEILLIYAVSLTMVQDMEKASRTIKKLDDRHMQEGWKDQEEHAELVSILHSLKAYVKLAVGEQEEFIKLISEQVQKGLVNDKWYLAPVKYNQFHAKLSRTPFGARGKYSNIDEMRAFSEAFRQTEFKELHVMGYSYGVLAEVLYEVNHLEEVLLEINEGLNYAHRFKDSGLYVPLYILKGKVYMIQGQMTAAHAVWDYALSQVSEWYWQRSIQAMKALAYLRENKLTEAEKELFKTERPDPLQIELGQEFWMLVYCRLLITRKKWELALEAAIEVHEHATKDDQVDLIIEASILEAICHKQLGQEDIAYVTLHTALVLGSRYGYKRIFIDEVRLNDLLLEYRAYKEIKNPFQEEVPTVYLEELNTISESAAHLDDRIDKLTSRERDVIRLLTSGLSNREMANQLFLSEGTIRVYLTKIYSKLGVKSRTQAILRAKEGNI